MAWNDPASDKQSSLIKSLFTKAQAALANADETTQAAVTEHVTSVQSTLVAVMAGQEIDKRQASSAIDALFAVDRLLASATAPSRLRNYQRVIPNRFAKACHSCGTEVPANEGFAALSGTWTTWCKPCANESDEARLARVVQEQAERAERAAALRAEQEADRVKRVAERAALQARGSEMIAFAIDLFVRTGTDDKKTPEVRVAIPSATGNNDLDFHRVRQNPAKDLTPKVFRVIGGRADQPLSVDQAHAVLERLVFTDVQAAMTVYGQEIGSCGHCGKSLTDHVSRYLGLGPVCRGHFGIVVTPEIATAAAAMAAAKGWPVNDPDEETDEVRAMIDESAFYAQRLSEYCDSDAVARMDEALESRRSW